MSDTGENGRGAVALFSRQPALIDAVEVALELTEIEARFFDRVENLDGAIGAVLIDLRDFPNVETLCDDIRARAGQGTPIFLLSTSDALVTSREEAHEIGADDLFTMPVSADRVLALLTMVLERPRPGMPTGVVFGQELEAASDDDAGSDESVSSFDQDPDQLTREAQLQGLLQQEAAFSAASDARARELDRIALLEAEAAAEREALEAETWEVWTHHDSEVRARLEAARERAEEERAALVVARDEALARAVTLEREREVLDEEKTRASTLEEELRELRAKLGRVEDDRDLALLELERVERERDIAREELEELRARSGDARSKEAEKLLEEIELLRAALDEERAASAEERRHLDERLAETLERERRLREEAETRAREATETRDRERLENQRGIEEVRERSRIERHALAEARAAVEEELRESLEEAQARLAELGRSHEAELADRERRSAEERGRQEREQRRAFDEELERRMRDIDEERADDERRYRAKLTDELRAEIEARLERQAESKRQHEASQRRALEARAQEEAERDRHERERRRDLADQELAEARRDLERERARLEAELRARAAFSTGMLESMLVEDADAAFSGGDVGSVPFTEGDSRGIPSGGARFPVDDDEQIEPPQPPPQFVPMEPREARFHVGEVAAVLWSAHALGVTGALELTDARGHARTVFLERGEPVAFTSELARDRPEEALLAAGLITKVAYNRMRAGPHLSARRACARLVDEGALKPEELFTAVRGVFTEQLLSILEWETGQYTYRELSAHAADRLRVTRRLDAILAEGVRRKFDEDRLWRALGGPRTLLGPDDRALRLPAFLPDEVAAARLFDGARSLADIILDTGADPHVVLRVGLALVSARAARVVARGVPMTQEEREARAERSLEIDRDRIRDRVHTARHGDYFDFLGVREDATLQEIQHAAGRLRDRFSPKRFQAPEFTDLRGALEEIVEVTHDAESVLVDEELRRGYTARLRKKRAALEDAGAPLPH